MHNDLVELGWTEEQWGLITGAVTEEAQKARVAAQMLPLVGPEDPSTIAVPPYALGYSNAVPPMRMVINSDPTLYLTTIAVNVFVRSHEAADPSLKAALGMFRRAANYVARIEDALVFNGRLQDAPPAIGIAGLQAGVFTVTGSGAPQGLIRVPPPPGNQGQRILQPVAIAPAPGLGERVINAIIDAIGSLDAAGQQGPYACALSQNLFNAVCTPNPNNFVMPRDRILPFLQGPLLRASAIQNDYGVVVSLSGSPSEIVVGSDISVRYLQTNLEPRYVFRVCERVALRIREENAIAVLHPANAD